MKPQSNAALPLPGDEATLVRRIVAGDTGAFESLMRQYNRRLFRVARATLRDAAEAEDALQDAYLHAYRSMDRFRGESGLSTWLCRLVLNECLGRLRRNARRQNVIPLVTDNKDTEIGAVAARELDMPDRIFARAELRALLERKLDELPDAFRIVFVLRSVEELSVEDTAQSLGIPEATVRSRHFRAKALLRESLASDFDAVERELFQFDGPRCDRIVARVLAKLATTG